MVETVRPDAAVGAEIVVPGSVANLGGGFDTLGVAVELYLRARIVDVRDDGENYWKNEIALSNGSDETPWAKADGRMPRPALRKTAVITSVPEPVTPPAT